MYFATEYNRGDIYARGTSCGGQNKESKNKKLVTRTGTRIITRIKNKLLCKERRQECRIEGFFYRTIRLRIPDAKGWPYR